MDWVIVAATMVIAVSAVASFCVTWRLSQDSRALRKAGTEPEVVAYLAPDPRSGFFINLVLENVGQGPACDVEYFVDADPEDFAKREVRNVAAGVTRKISSLLPQGERVERMLGVGNRLYGKDEDARLRPFRVEVCYSNLRGVRAGPKEYVLDIAEFGGSAEITPAEKRIADSLEKIQTQLGHLSSGFNRLHVETTTTAERQAAERERVAHQIAKHMADEADGQDAP